MFSTAIATTPGINAANENSREVFVSVVGCIFDHNLCQKEEFPTEAAKQVIMSADS